MVYWFPEMVVPLKIGWFMNGKFIYKCMIYGVPRIYGNPHVVISHRVIEGSLEVKLPTIHQEEDSFFSFGVL